MSRKPIPLTAPMVITITANATTEIVSMFPDDIPWNAMIRVQTSGPHYGANRV